MKVIKSIALIFLITIVGLCSSCSDKTVQTDSSHDFSANVSFEEIFYEFNDVKKTTDELVAAAVDTGWWQKYDLVFNNVNALYYANLQTSDSNQLSETDAVLSKSLVDILLGYKNAYEIMAASRNSNDGEIINYARNEFTTQITQANTKWTQALTSITATTQPPQSTPAE